MKRAIPIITVTLVVAWCVTVLLSWLLSAMMVPGVRSLLTGEGIRWLFAHFTDGLSTPLLVWLLLASMAVGCLSRCSLLMGTGAYRRRIALRVALLLLLLYVAAIALLTLPPHAVLLSATGTLVASPFSRALVPVLCFGVVLVSVAYGLVARTLTSVGDIIDAMLHGIRTAAPLFLLYVLATQLFQTLCYVFFCGG